MLTAGPNAGAVFTGSTPDHHAASASAAANLKARQRQPNRKKDAATVTGKPPMLETASADGETVARLDGGDAARRAAGRLSGGGNARP
jgi:hypothetical protein